MLRVGTETGWWLVTHPDHARLAAAVAEKWGNDKFLSPEPRVHVLKAIALHDDGWLDRDAAPQLTRQGKPSAFSVELVGKYSAFEEIDLADYLSVRGRAVRLIAAEDPYAAILISMHTHNLLTAHADRSTIAPAQLPLLDEFIEGQKVLQESLMREIAADPHLSPEQKTGSAILNHFRLLQATDNLSLLSCVDFRQPAHLLHPLPLRGGGQAHVQVRSKGKREFVLDPYPFAEPSLCLTFPARHVLGRVFGSAVEFQEQFNAAPVEQLTAKISSS